MSYSIHLIPFGTPAYDETVRLRNEILVQPLGISFTMNDFALEYQQYHLACYNSSMQLVGCLVLVPLTEGEVKMRQVAVAQNYQNKGLGRLMVTASEQFLRGKGFSRVVMNARDNVILFYEKLGYQKVGKSFTEVTIRHFKMIKDL